MADTTKVLQAGESVYNAIEPLRDVLEARITNYNSSQERKWRMRFASGVIKAVAEERGNDFGELYGSIEETLICKGKKVFESVADSIGDDGSSLAAIGIDKFLAFQIAQKTAEKLPPKGQRGASQIPEGGYVEFEVVSYSDSRKKGEWAPLVAKIRYKHSSEAQKRQLIVNGQEIPPRQDFFVGNLLPIHVEDDRDFIYYNARITIADVPELVAVETYAYKEKPEQEKPRERKPTQVDIEAASLFASAEAGWQGEAPKAAVEATLKKVMAGQQGGNGTNGNVKKPGRIGGMPINTGGGGAYAAQ